MTDVLNCIHNKMDRLSKGQKKIAAFILESYDKAAFLTAGALGKTVQVSESTVVRFAGELGYDGYPELQRALQEMVLNRLTSVQRLEMSSKRLGEANVLQTVFQSDMEHIRATGEGLDHEAFAASVDALVRARRVYIIGVRSSAALAAFVRYYLNYMLDDVRLVTSASESEVFEAIVRISPEDVLLGISFPRYSAAASHAMEYAHDAGAVTIALTDTASSPLAQNADYLLAAKSDMVSFVDSLVAPMSVINALLVAVASRRRAEATETFDKLEDIWDVYHVYEKNDE